MPQLAACILGHHHQCKVPFYAPKCTDSLLAFVLWQTSDAFWHKGIVLNGNKLCFSLKYAYSGEDPLNLSTARPLQIKIGWAPIFRPTKRRLSSLKCLCILTAVRLAQPQKLAAVCGLVHVLECELQGALSPSIPQHCTLPEC